MRSELEAGSIVVSEPAAPAEGSQAAGLNTPRKPGKGNRKRKS